MVLPEDDAHLTPAHQDYYFIRETPRFYTLWIPLMDIVQQVGGLAVAPGSHKRGLREHVEQDVFSTIFRDRKQRGIALSEVPPPWATTDYHAGDLLIFNSQTIHWALPNRSRLVRLSFDTRCQPASDKRIRQLEYSTGVLRQYRADIKRVATEEGASEDLFEEVVIEMMRRDLPAEPATIRSVIGELSART